jgi:hypothetical protein
MIEFGETAKVKLSGAKKEGFTTTAKVDTGAGRTAIDYNFAATVGVGPVISTVKVTQTSGTDRRPVAKMGLKYQDFEEEIEVGLADRKKNDLEYKMIIGKDILRREDVIINLS